MPSVTCDGKSTIHSRNLWVRGSNLSGGFDDRLICPHSAVTALKTSVTWTLNSYHTCYSCHNIHNVILSVHLLCHCGSTWTPSESSRWCISDLLCFNEQLSSRIFWL